MLTTSITVGWVSAIGSSWKATLTSTFGGQSAMFASPLEAKAFVQGATNRPLIWSQSNSADQPTQYVGKVTIVMAGQANWVNGVVDLRTVVGSAVFEIYLTSYALDPADEGGGIWTWTNDTITADNTGTVVVPTALPRTGCWKRVYDGAVNVRWFGAIGDGVADDTSDIQAAITNTAAVGGGVVLIPQGTFLLTDALTMASNIELCGEGAASTLSVSAASLINPIIELPSLSDTKLRNFRIEGNADEPLLFGANNAIWAVGCTRLAIENVLIEDSLSAGIWLDGCASTTINNVTCLRCGRTGGGITNNHGIVVINDTVHATSDIIIGNCIVEAARRKGITIDSNGWPMSNIVVSACAVTDCGLGGIYLAAPSSVAMVQNAAVTGNVVEGCYTNILISQVENWTCVGNTCRESTGDSGINITDASNGVISGNNCHKNAAHGIYIRGTTNPAIGLTVSGNNSSDNNQAAGGGNGINLVKVAQSIVTGNVCSDNQLLATQGAGILEDTDCYSNIITNNVCIGNTSIGMTPAYITLANGLNSNVYLPGYDEVYIAGPTGVFSIGGFQRPIDKRRITLFSNVAHALTIVNEDLASTAANRILTLTGADITLPARTVVVSFLYSAPQARWLYLGYS